MVATSHWQLLSYRLLPPSSLAASARPSSPEYIITYFSATLFTPAGVDVYQRQGGTSLSEGDVEILREKCEEVLELREVMSKGEGMFRIPHDPPAMSELERRKSRVL